MPLTDEELAQQKAHFWSRTAYYASLGYDRLAAAAFVLDEAGPLDGPVLDVGTGMGITARGLAGRGLDVVTVDTNAHDQEVAAFAHRRAGALAAHPLHGDERRRAAVSGRPFRRGGRGRRAASPRGRAPRARGAGARRQAGRRRRARRLLARGLRPGDAGARVGGPRAPGRSRHDGLGARVPLRRPGLDGGESVDGPVAPGQRAAGSGGGPNLAGVRLARSGGPAAVARGVREQLARPRRLLVPRGGGALRHGGGHRSRRRLVAAVRGRRGAAHHGGVRHPARRRSRVSPAGPRLPDVQLHQSVADRGLAPTARA